MADIAVETKTYEQPAAPVPPDTPAATPEVAQSEVPESEEQPEAPAVVPETPERPEAEAPPEASGDKKRNTPKWAQDRIDALTRKKGEAEREATRLRIELEAMKQGASAPVDGEQPEGKPAPQQPDIKTLVEQEAQRLVEQRTFQTSVNNVMKQGNDEYPDFNDRCNFLADLGAADNPNFMPTIAVLDEGHKVLAELSDNPEEAQRILNMPPIQMAAALGRIAAKSTAAASASATPAKKVSAAPAPIKTIDGTAKATDSPSTSDPDEVWFQKRIAQRTKDRQAKGARF